MAEKIEIGNRKPILGILKM